MAERTVKTDSAKAMAEVREAKDAIWMILDLGQKPDFEGGPDEMAMLALVEEVKRELFAFMPIEQTVARVGKTCKVQIRTTPETVPVTFALDDESDNLKLETVYSTGATLIYKPRAEDAETTRMVTITASSGGPSKTVEIAIHVRSRASRGLVWWLKRAGIGVAVTAAGYGVCRLAGGCGAGGDEGKRPWLPDPPLPPER
jgi:hypothetical protein